MTVRSNHRHTLVALVAVLALLGSACGLSRDSAGGTAATVTFADGTTSEISVDQLDSFYDSIAEDDEFVQGAYGEVGLPPGLRASMLSDLIVGSVVDKLLVDMDAPVSDANQDAGTESIQSIVATLFPTADDPAATAEGRFETLPYLPYLAGLQAKQFALGDALVAVNGGGETVEVPCSSHILLATEEEADEVIALLEDGGDFAELAMEYSTGPSGPTGGVLGCTDPASFVVEFADAITDAPVGEIIGPVQTEFGFHVITVTGVEEQTVGAPDAQQLVSTELLSAISQISVDVAPTIGEWDGAQGQVIPPG